MVEIVWCTDVHLDCLELAEIKEWIDRDILTKPGDTILITGDISTADKLHGHLDMLKKFSSRRIIYVLGNHDYWNGSISALRSGLATSYSGAEWLGNVSFIEMGSHAIVGHDGWYDGGYGNAKKSRFVMRDWFSVKEFLGADLLAMCRKLAQDGTDHIVAGCESAIAAGKESILIATHFPPYPDVSMYRGRRSDDHALPWYTSKILGDALLVLATKHANVKFTVLCGHTHSAAEAQMLPNLRVIVGSSDYGTPPSTVLTLE